MALLDEVCRGRGFLLRGGELDTDRACAVVLDEFREGKVGRITLEVPPAYSPVTELAKDALAPAADKDRYGDDDEG